MYPELILGGYGVGLDITNAEIDIYTPSNNCFMINATTNARIPTTCYHSSPYPVVGFIILILSCFLLWYFRHEIFRFMRDRPVPLFSVATLYIACNLLFIYISKWFAVGMFVVYSSIPYITTLPESEQLLWMNRMNTSITTMMNNGLDARLIWTINTTWDCYLWVSMGLVVTIVTWYMIRRNYQWILSIIQNRCVNTSHKYMRMRSEGIISDAIFPYACSTKIRRSGVRCATLGNFQNDRTILWLSCSAYYKRNEWPLDGAR